MAYFDHNATAPLLPSSRDAWLRAADEAWANPASPYRAAARVKAHLDAARNRLAGLVGCASDRLVFTSGATEAANAVLRHWATTLPADSAVAINPTEHPCVLQTASALFGPRVVPLAVDRNGVVDLASLRVRLTPTPGQAPLAAVVVMAANNETGVLQPWPAIAALCRETGVDYLCDSSQWLGKLPGSGLGAAPWFFASAHKFGGPKGAGFLARPDFANSFHAQLGGEQQHGARAGTEDFPNAAALVAALAETDSLAASEAAERLVWRRTFEVAVQKAIPGSRVAGGTAERLWNTVDLVMPHSENHRWVLKLDRRDFQVSTGSACSTGAQGPSHVLAALGYSVDEARRSVRISGGWKTSRSDWDSLALAFAAVDNELSPNQTSS